MSVTPVWSVFALSASCFIAELCRKRPRTQQPSLTVDTQAAFKSEDVCLKVEVPDIIALRKV